VTLNIKNHYYLDTYVSGSRSKRHKIVEQFMVYYSKG